MVFVPRIAFRTNTSCTHCHKDHVAFVDEPCIIRGHVTFIFKCPDCGEIVHFDNRMLELTYPIPKNAIIAQRDGQES